MVCSKPIGYAILSALADLEGVCAGRMATPMGPNSFIFAHIFTKKCPHQRSMPPQWVHAPLWEILDLPLIRFIFQTLSGVE